MRLAARVFTLLLATALLPSPAMARVTIMAGGKTESTAIQLFAERSARDWLALVDSGEYQQSWRQSATVFRQQLTPADWRKAVMMVRAPLGTLQERKLHASRYTRSLPGMPDGEYVVIRYVVRFANKGFAMETVTPMRDRDGHWRVSGYFIR